MFSTFLFRVIGFRVLLFFCQCLIFFLLSGCLRVPFLELFLGIQESFYRHFLEDLSKLKIGLAKDLKVLGGKDKGLYRGVANAGCRSSRIVEKGRFAKKIALVECRNVESSIEECLVDGHSNTALVNDVEIFGRLVLLEDHLAGVKLVEGNAATNFLKFANLDVFEKLSSANKLSEFFEIARGGLDQFLGYARANRPLDSRRCFGLGQAS